MKIVVPIYLLLLFFSCNNKPISTNTNNMILNKKLDIQGHRGCRGLMPENTIPAFLKALELGVTTLEMDVVISKDKQVVVSHEPFLSHEFCTAADGSEITLLNEKIYNLYQMEYAQIKGCDCGQKPHPRFPEQQKMSIYKPLLKEVIDSAEQYVKTHHLKPIYYNIEVKYTEAGKNIYHPEQQEFVQLFLDIIQEKGIEDRVIFQCFDMECLVIGHRIRPNLKTALLMDTPDSKGIEKDIKTLGFKPTIYSPNYNLVDSAMIHFGQQNNVQIIPWTINEVADMQRLIKLGVDGLITDYPNRLLDFLKK